jgi:two-component system, chemotaxis family, sensor kinase CheA
MPPVDELLSDFLAETNEGLAELDVALVRLKQVPQDRETLSLVFRLVHTIKGTCGFLGLVRLEQVAHAAESVLGWIRDGKLSATAEIVTLVLRAVDQIKLIVAEIGTTGAEQPGDDTAVIVALNRAASGGRARAPDDTAATGEPIEHGAACVEQENVAHGGASAATIRVSVDALEHLTALVSELVLTRNQLLQLARARQDKGFAAPLQRLSHITSGLQEGVMKTRMQPIGGAWNKLPRLVRDLGHALGKSIELVMRGAETELDRQVLELIRDPLMHMVRNSADHGLEPPEERRARGKPETGRITLNAFHEGGHIIIEISDDGRGLPVERIRAKALARGLASEAELASMSDSQIQEFIFQPGFSTAAQVTSVSGRGVGMDVVKTNIELIRGAIALDSVPGEGTRFVIKIPLTLAIVSALIVEAGRERFAIPQISVVELVRPGRNGSDGEGVIEQIKNTPVLRLGEQLLPLVSLAGLLGLEDQPEAEAEPPTIVVTRAGHGLLGIVVDQVFDPEKIAAKPVAPILRNITMFGGSTILGDGSVIMILDPDGVARASGITGGESHRSGEWQPMLLLGAGAAPARGTAGAGRESAKGAER